MQLLLAESPPCAWELQGVNLRPGSLESPWGHPLAARPSVGCSWGWQGHGTATCPVDSEVLGPLTTHVLQVLTLG